LKGHIQKNTSDTSTGPHPEIFIAPPADVEAIFNEFVAEKDRTLESILHDNLTDPFPSSHISQLLRSQCGRSRGRLNTAWGARKVVNGDATESFRGQSVG
jgi:hypothetical protein